MKHFTSCRTGRAARDNLRAISARVIVESMEDSKYVHKAKNDFCLFPGKQRYVQAPLPLVPWFSLRTLCNLCAVARASILSKYMRKQCRDHKIAAKYSLEVVKGHKCSLCLLTHEISHCEKSGISID